MIYSVDENFFYRDTPESFYWAGFIAADGCVSYTRKNKTSGFLSILLSAQDIGVLEKFKKAVGFDGNIRITKPTDHNPNGLAKLQISRIKMLHSLERFNIVENKTKVYKFPKWMVNHNLVNHFMRGYVDGDGSFFITKQSGRNHLNFGVCGTREFLVDFRNILKNKCDLRENKICESKRIWDLRYAGNGNVFKIRDFLYNGAQQNIMMDRKYKKAYDKSLLIIPKSSHKFRAVVGVNINNGNKIALDSACFGRVLGFNPKAISACCVGRRKSHKMYVWSFING